MHKPRYKNYCTECGEPYYSYLESPVVSTCDTCLDIKNGISMLIKAQKPEEEELSFSGRVQEQYNYNVKKLSDVSDRFDGTVAMVRALEPAITANRMFIVKVANQLSKIRGVPFDTITKVMSDANARRSAIDKVINENLGKQNTTLMKLLNDLEACNAGWLYSKNVDAGIAHEKWMTQTFGFMPSEEGPQDDSEEDEDSRYAVIT